MCTPTRPWFVSTYTSLHPSLNTLVPVLFHVPGDVPYYIILDLNGLFLSLSRFMGFRQVLHIPTHHSRTYLVLNILLE